MHTILHTGLLESLLSFTNMGLSASMFVSGSVFSALYTLANGALKFTGIGERNGSYSTWIQQRESIRDRNWLYASCVYLDLCSDMFALAAGVTRERAEMMLEEFGHSP